MLDEFSHVKSAPLWGFFVLIALYIAGTYFVQFTSSAQGVFQIWDNAVPYRMLTGAFSSMCNLCIMMLVVLYKKPGFYVALISLIAQFPLIIIRLIRDDYTVISALFSNVLIIITVLIIYWFTSRAAKDQERMRKHAVTDQITGIPNRFAVSEMMDMLIRKNEPFAIAVLNLNYFKNINNTLGQQAGDETLIQIARRWQDIADDDSSGTRDFVACQSGGEFTVVIRDYRDEEQLRRCVERYAKALEEKIVLDDYDFFLSCSIGYATFPEDARDGEELFDCAYCAMYQAKKTDHSGYICRFTQEMLNNDQTIEIERKIRDALEHGRLDYNLQPQYDMNHRLRGFEALARIVDENGNSMKTTDFIPVAEKTGLVDRIDREVMFASTAFVADLIRKTGKKVTLSVNASVRHLMRNNYVDEVKEALRQSGLPAEQLEIEITESIMIGSVEKARECILSITELGVKIAIDDFGTGYSSLSYLNAFPVDVLKVDRSFIVKMNEGEASRKYVAAIIAIGHVMNFHVVAEGVEDPEQLEALRKIGCDYIQGFLWGRPLAPEEAAKLVG